MVDKIETGLIGRIKSLIPGRKSQVPAVVPTTQPQEASVTVAQKERPPHVLSPFEQVQQLLERESETTDPDKVTGSRRVELRKMVYNYDHSPRTKDPAHITIQQNRINGEWDGSIRVYIGIVTDDDRKKYNREHHLRGLPEGKNLQGSLVISQQEPQLTLEPNPRHPSYPFNDPEGIWGILGLSRPKYESDTSIWSYKTVPGKGSGKGDFYTTNNDGELRKVAHFITEDLDHSTPKVISRR